MDHKDRFSDRVIDYYKYRPHYPAELFQFIDFTFLSEVSTIADIGSGTGISARPFLESGHRVFGVEPNEPMRSFSERDLSAFINYTAIDGSAEDTKLGSDSTDLIFCAQSFHWFDHKKALKEFNRILRDNGIVCLVWNDRNTDDTAFSKEYEKLIIKHSLDYQKVNHKQIDLTFLANVIPHKVAAKEFSNCQQLDMQGLIGRLASSSYMPPREHQGFTSLVEDLENLFDRHSFRNIVEITYTTRLFYFSFND